MFFSSLLNQAARILLTEIIGWGEALESAQEIAVLGDTTELEVLFDLHLVERFRHDGVRATPLGKLVAG